MAILIVEDEARIAEFVKRGLEAEGYLVDWVPNGQEAIQVGASPVYEVIILDLMLPDLSGRDVCRRLRADGVETPVLMLTAMDTLDDKVTGLRIGADDYLTKPFAFEELLARIEALLRRGRSFEQQSASLAVADLVLNKETKEVSRGGQTIELTPKEFALLEYFMSMPGKVVSRTKILEQVWGYNADPLTNVVEVYIRNLRRKIDEGFETALIKTVRGFGYKLEVN